MSHVLLFFASQAWPPVNAVRELATRLKEKAKQGETCTFIDVDLKKCVYDGCQRRQLV